MPVALTVILDDVSAAHDFLREIGVLQHALADAEEGRVSPALLEFRLVLAA